MDTQTIYEIIGYIASGLVAISLTMSSILRLRIINLLGGIFFTIYGLLIQAYPVAAVNAFVVLIDLYYLRQMLRIREYFSYMEVRPDSVYLQRFLDFYDAEIQKFLPGFKYDRQAVDVVFFVHRNMLPAGVFIGQRVDNDALLVKLDFVIPGYRDFKVADYLFRQNSQLFTERGIRRIYSRPGNKAHASYLKRMGFQPGGNFLGEPSYSLEIED